MSNPNVSLRERGIFVVVLFFALFPLQMSPESGRRWSLWRGALLCSTTHRGNHNRRMLDWFILAPFAGWAGIERNWSIERLQWRTWCEGRWNFLTLCWSRAAHRRRKRQRVLRSVCLWCRRWTLCTDCSPHIGIGKMAKRFSWFVAILLLFEVLDPSLLPGNRFGKCVAATCGSKNATECVDWDVLWIYFKSLGQCHSFWRRILGCGTRWKQVVWRHLFTNKTR